jgi:hypothetical protein
MMIDMIGIMIRQRPSTKMIERDHDQLPVKSEYTNVVWNYAVGDCSSINEGELSSLERKLTRTNSKPAHTGNVENDTKGS